jgi:hypothetical protein
VCEVGCNVHFLTGNYAIQLPAEDFHCGKLKEDDEIVQNYGRKFKSLFGVLFPRKSNMSESFCSFSTQTSTSGKLHYV